MTRNDMIGLNNKLGNIFTVYCRADKWDREWGMSAYEKYHDKINKISDDASIHVGSETACGIFAALSPNIDEASNFKALRKMLNGGDVSSIPGYPKNIGKAIKILHGSDPLEILSGNKTRAFFLNLWDFSNTAHPVVVDAHMYSVWRLRRFKVTEAKISDEEYKLASRDFGIVASHLDIRPNQLQAICWSTWKRINNIMFDSQLKLIK